jgi:hypothetical protein
MKCSKSFEFDYRVLSGRLRIKTFCGSENTQQLRTTPCTRDADLKNDSYRKGERETIPAKQHQDKDQCEPDHHGLLDAGDDRVRAPQES